MRSIKVRREIKNKNKNLILAKVNSSRAKPFTREEIEELKINGVLTLQIFKENIGKLFPVVLERVAIGETIKSIEIFLGMRERSLECFIQNFPKLDKAVKEARKLKSDEAALKDLLS